MESYQFSLSISVAGTPVTVSVVDQRGQDANLPRLVVSGHVGDGLVVDFTSNDDERVVLTVGHDAGFSEVKRNKEDPETGCDLHGDGVEINVFLHDSVVILEEVAGGVGADHEALAGGPGEAGAVHAAAQDHGVDGQELLAVQLVADVQRLGPVVAAAESGADLGVVLESHVGGGLHVAGDPGDGVVYLGGGQQSVLLALPAGHQNGCKLLLSPDLGQTVLPSVGAGGLAPVESLPVVQPATASLPSRTTT